MVRRPRLIPELLVQFFAATGLICKSPGRLVPLYGAFYLATELNPKMVLWQINHLWPSICNAATPMVLLDGVWGGAPHKRPDILKLALPEVGLIEPLVVYPQKDSPGKYMLKNGHLRYFALKDLGKTEADCLIATDDECYTYNARISRLPPIQEHKMIVKAVNNGVSPERLASVLNMPLRVVQASMNLLKGIHPDAAELLKDKNICPKALKLFRRVNGNRQIEMAEMMVTMNNYVAGYAEAMVLGTPQHQLVNPDEPKKKAGMSPEDIARMESEMELLERDLKAVTDNYTENMFTLQTAQTYIKSLLKNAKVVRYLNANHAEIYSEFEVITAAESV